MSLRRLHHEQPASFAFTPANLDWAHGQIAKYPEGRQASAVIPLLWRAQEQEGWVTRPAIETVARMLGMAQIRVLEVATFYFMFQLRPVGSVAHVQVCGTTSCMICGAEDLVGLCRERIAPEPHDLSADGRFSWEEVECLGACANAPMVQIGKDYYEDLDRDSLGAILDALARGEVPRPGSARGRWASEPLGGLTSLTGEAQQAANGSVELAVALGDTVARIDGSGPTASDLALGRAARSAPSPAGAEPAAPGEEPPRLDTPRGGEPDDLRQLRGLGPKLEEQLHELGVFHFDQIAGLTEAQLDWLDAQRSGLKKVALREDWIETAKALVAGKGEV